jgi:hypothetical protein
VAIVQEDKIVVMGRSRVKRQRDIGMAIPVDIGSGDETWSSTNVVGYGRLESAVTIAHDQKETVKRADCQVELPISIEVSRLHFSTSHVSRGHQHAWIQYTPALPGKQPDSTLGRKGEVGNPIAVEITHHQVTNKRICSRLVEDWGLKCAIAITETYPDSRGYSVSVYASSYNQISNTVSILNLRQRRHMRPAMAMSLLDQ